MKELSENYKNDYDYNYQPWEILRDKTLQETQAEKSM